MTAPIRPTPDISTLAPDLADPSRPGSGVASQDPQPAAQQLLGPSEVMREANSTVVGGGAMAGTAAGAAIGAALGGPVGVVVGAAIGGVAGAVGTAAASIAANHRNDAAGTPADAVHLHVDDTGGTGRPVVLIHGWPLSAQAWTEQTAALQAAGYRVVAYDRRGFGRSDKPESSYGYDTLADDLARLLDGRDLRDVTLVGFSMGGGEVARYIARHGESRLHSVVFAAAVPPFLMKSADNPEGPLAPEKAQEMKSGLENDRGAFFEQFTRDFFSAGGDLKVTEQQRQDAVALCHQSAQHAALACMEAFGTTDFRDDRTKVTVPTLVLHGDADAIVPVEGSGARTHRAVAHSQLVTVPGAPHGLNVSHAREFNEALLAFLRV